MPTYSTTINTVHGRKYLQQLCKHFGHKVKVRYSPEEGRVAFPPGRCFMHANDDALKFSFISDEEQGAPVIKHIIDEHLETFAWREDLEYTWSKGAPDEIAQILMAADFLSDGDTIRTHDKA